jgi:hypothetical protein
MKEKQTHARPIFIVLFVFFFLIPILTAMFLPALASTGKPTPRQKAYRACLSYVWFVNNSATNNQFTLNASDLFNGKTPVEFARWAFSAETLAKQGEKFLIKTNCDTAKTNNGIIIVCERQFRYDDFNTSLWNFFRHNYVYVVGRSDGKAGFITPTEFTNLNLNGFVSLSALATNSELNFPK